MDRGDFWDNGGGLFSDWGVHLLDMGLWTNDILKAPKKVMAYAADTSGQSGMRDSFDTMNVVYPKENYVINFDMTAGVQRGPWDKMYGIAFVGDNGTIVTDRNGYRVYPEYEGDENRYRTEIRELSGIANAYGTHVRNFLDCIKTREKPVYTPEIGCAAAVHAHIPNIAGRVGASYLEWDDTNMRFTNNEQANELITPEYRSP